MALVGTISGSNNTSNTAITGTLVIANTTLQFPIIQSDAVLFVSGNIGGNSKAVFGGDVQISGSAIVSGDIAVNGGDFTSSATIFNLIPSGSTGNTLNVGETTGVVQIGRATGPTTVRLAYGNTTSPSVKTVEIGTNGQAGSTTNITLGTTTGNGRTTFNNDVALTTGNIIGAPGAGANVMTLISSGNIIARLDTDNSAPGHKFAVQDYLNIDKFSITEAGAAEIADTLFATGSITTSGSLKSVMSIGSEGGEIFLSSPASSTTINTGVNIDVYQDKVRIFETGGSTRGGYYDVTKLGSSVSTDLLRGDPLFAFISRKILILQAMDGNTGGGNFGVFPFSMATTVANTGQIITNSDNFLGFTSLATIGSAAIFRTTNVWTRIGHTGRIRGRLVTGADITSQTITFGLGTGITATGAGNSFSYAPAESQILAVYNAGTANWQLLTNNAGVTSTADTGVVVAINTEYYFDLQFTGASVSLSVNNSTPVSLSTNLPAAGTSMYARMGIYPTANAARSMNVLRCVFEAGTPSVY